MKKTAHWLIFYISTVVFIACALLFFFNTDILKKKPFQTTTSFDAPAVAKFEKDGNLYVIDSGSFRLVCMSPDRKIHYTIEINKFKEYTRIIDGAIDDAGNLYVYAIEAEYDALLTKRDIIRKYDNHGNFVKDIISISYNNAYTNPRLFSQFGSFRCDDGILTFSQTLKDKVILYSYDTYRDDLRSSELYEYSPGNAFFNFIGAQLIQKDFNNYAYVLRDGDIYEVVNSAAPVLRASFNWSIEEGGIHPWFIFYDSNEKLIFFDMGSNSLLRINNDEVVYDESGLQHVVPKSFFEPLIAQGKLPCLNGFGFHEKTYAGIYDDVVWLYDGHNFSIYDGDLHLPIDEQFYIAFIQVALAIGIIAFFTGLYIMFIKILARYISLFIKQTVIIIPLLIIAFIIVFTVTFNIMTERENERMFNDIIGLAKLSAGMINGDDLDKIKTIKDFHSDEYKRLSVLVKEIVGYNADPWNKAYYAAIYKGENFEYVVVISEEEWNLFRTDAPTEGEDYDTLMSGKPIVATTDLYNGKWTFSNTPIYNSAGEITGKFEVGLDMTSHEIGNTKLKRQVALITAFICIFILFALGVMVSVVVKQLSSVADVLHAIADGNRNERVRYKALDELGKVGRGLNRMAEELQNQFDRINRLNESTIRFVPVQFMEHLGVSDITKMNLGDNVQRNISVLFFDIRYFSVNSEMMTASENFIFINKILGIAGPIIRKHNGFVDKYIGDAAMALFINGIDAVRAGIELYNTLVVDDETKVKIGVDGINIGVGIHSGSVMMGIVGENERLSSTVISDNVNLTSRLEGLTKQTGSGLLFTRDTLNQLAGFETEFEYRFIGMVRAAGVNEVVALFDMLDALPPEEKKARLLTKQFFESGVRKYHMKDYATAVERFKKVTADDPQDICAQHYLNEAIEHLENPELPSVFIFNRK
ncbi:MAG: HAMP domain-containing protein [Treponema sp.]|nr:HAMP domain-containing protein [Treponema sp.]